MVKSGVGLHSVYRHIRIELVHSTNRCGLSVPLSGESEILSGVGPQHICRLHA